MLEQEKFAHKSRNIRETQNRSENESKYINIPMKVQLISVAGTNYVKDAKICLISSTAETFAFVMQRRDIQTDSFATEFS